MTRSTSRATQRKAQTLALMLGLIAAACSSNGDEGAAGGAATGMMGSAATGGAAGTDGNVPTAGMAAVDPTAGAGGEIPVAGTTAGTAGVAGTGGDTGELPMLAADTPWADVPEACKSFEILGMTTSPGGDELPNKCAPFDGTLNNPYAIRCIDADPAFDTGFPGDEWCILPPPPELGTQVHVGPDSYESVDPSYIMATGEEINDYYYVNAINDEEHYYYRTNWRMRSGSHHMIISVMEDRADGFSGSGDVALGGSSRSFGGAQRPDQDRPQGSLDVPAENIGLGARLDAGQQFSFNLHHFNLTGGDILREAWVNVWYKPEADVTDPMEGIAIFGNPADLNIPAGEHRELHYACDVSEQTRIITLNGHRHASTDRFGVWLERGSETIPIYESFYYTDMPTYQYDSISMNPVPDLDSKTDGAFTGMLEVGPGDKIHFVCDITNRNDTALRFANEVQTGEMCILFGSRTGGALCGLAVRQQ